MLVNLTPHPITLRDAQGIDHIVPPAKPAARVSSTPGALNSTPGVPVPVASPTVFGEVEGLPAPAEGTFYVVSALVGAALRGSRNDILMPGTGPADGAIRDADGRIMAVTRLVRA